MLYNNIVSSVEKSIRISIVKNYTMTSTHFSAVTTLTESNLDLASPSIVLSLSSVQFRIVFFTIVLYIYCCVII